MNPFDNITIELINLIKIWEPRLLSLSEKIISDRVNSQNRTIKQITGHLVDSASNNLHRIVHLQYQPSPLIFPDYANLGNNDRWIGIQDYQHENWNNIVMLWKYINLHLIHVINNVNQDKLENIWITALKKEVSLKNMITDYLRHFRLHLDEIEQLING
ncbi:MAG TPA: DinB family protein [Bacteroidales bacterium]|jgi:hypothetical protein|nr:DinB family protein [Bacteroidales bacterium]